MPWEAEYPARLLNSRPQHKAAKSVCPSLSMPQSTPISSTVFHLCDQTMSILQNLQLVQTNLSHNKMGRLLRKRTIQTGIVKVITMAEEIGVILGTTLKRQMTGAATVVVLVVGMEPQPKALSNHPKVLHDQLGRDGVTQGMHPVQHNPNPSVGMAQTQLLLTYHDHLLLVIFHRKMILLSITGIRPLLRL